MPSALSQHPRDRLPVAMHDRRMLPPLELPPGGAGPEAQVGITPRPHTRLEATHLLERHPPHRGIRGLRKRPLIVSERDLLAHRGLQPGIPRSTRAVVCSRLLVNHRPRQYPDRLTRHRLEVPSEQVHRWQHIAIKKDQPSRRAERSRPIASVIRRLQLARPQHAQPPRAVAIPRPPPVVGHGDGVARLQIKSREPLENNCKLRIRPPKRKHDINRRPPAHSPNLRRGRSSPPRLPILAVP